MLIGGVPQAVLLEVVNFGFDHLLVILSAVLYFSQG
jgi:hypothetical protein